MSLNLQARFLRVLQEKKVIRLGGSKVIPIDVRVIAAINRDLKKMVFEKNLGSKILVVVEAFGLPSEIVGIMRHFTGYLIWV